MRTLRHPIVVFVTAVLVVISIGVGIVAGTQTSKVYGPQWGQFTVNFPAVPMVDPPGYPDHTWLAYKLSRSSYEQITVTVHREKGPWTTAAEFARLDHKLTGRVWTL